MLAVAIGLLLAVPGLIASGDPNSDGLFYEVQAKQLQGESHGQAMDEVFSGPAARETAAIEDEPSGVVRVLDPEWEQFSAQFYERRWTVPGLALVAEETTGESVGTALKNASMIGYALVGAALFLLLRRRYGVATSLLAGLACLLLPPMYRWSFGQFVDSWGVLIETLGLCALVVVSERGLRWLPFWIGSMLLLSVTRDATMVLGIAAIWLALGQRRSAEQRRRNLWILVSGAAAAVPALFFGGAPVRENLAYILNGYEVPKDDSWSHIAAEYPGQLWNTISGDFSYSFGLGAPGLAVFVAVTVAALAILLTVLRRANGDSFWLMVHGAILGCVLLLLVANNPQGFRLELVLVPAVAAGFAIAVEWARGRLPALGVARPS